MAASIIAKHNASSFIMVTVHSVEQAEFYLAKNRNQMRSAFVKTPEDFQRHKQAGIPFHQMIAFIGPEIKESNQQMYALLNGQGTMCMISSAPSYDKRESREERAGFYRKVFADGASILESDYPIEISIAIQ